MMLCKDRQKARVRNDRNYMLLNAIGGIYIAESEGKINE